MQTYLAHWWRLRRTLGQTKRPPLTASFGLRFLMPWRIQSESATIARYGESAYHRPERRTNPQPVETAGAKPKPSKPLPRKRKISPSRRSLPFPGFAYTPSNTRASHNMESPLALAQVNAGPRTTLWWYCARARKREQRRNIAK